MKTTRRFISAVMALAIVSALAPMSVFADTVVDNTNNPAPKPAGFDVKYTYTPPAPTYTVTIPAGVTLSDSDSVNKSIKAESVTNMEENGKKIVVTLDEATNDNDTDTTFHAKNGESDATYTITAGSTAVKVGDTVAEFTDNGSVELEFSKITLPAKPVAGDYTETLTFGISVEDSFESVLAPALDNGATMVVTYKWNGYNTTTFTFTNNNGTYSCNVGGDEPQDFSGSLTLNGTTLALSITNSVMSSRINLAISFDTTNDTYSFVTKGSWYNSHTVSVNGTNITDKLTAKN